MKKIFKRLCQAEIVNCCTLSLAHLYVHAWGLIETDILTFFKMRLFVNYSVPFNEHGWI